jgi:hypothetical protein
MKRTDWQRTPLTRTKIQSIRRQVVAEEPSFRALGFAVVDVVVGVLVGQPKVKDIKDTGRGTAAVLCRQESARLYWRYMSQFPGRPVETPDTGVECWSPDVPWLARAKAGGGQGRLWAFRSRLGAIPLRRRCTGSALRRWAHGLAHINAPVRRRTPSGDSASRPWQWRPR